MQIKKIPIKKGISLLLLYIFIINIVFLPNDTFQLKKISFALLVAINFDAVFYKKGNLNTLVFCFALILPLYIILKSTVLTGDFLGNVRIVFAGFMLLLYFIIKKYDFDFEKVLMQVLMSLAVFMLFMAALDFSGILPTMSNPILMWFYTTENAMIGRGARHAFGIIYFMKASSLLLLCLPYCIKRKKYIWAGIVLLALIISGTRANVFLGIIVLLSCLIYREQNIRRRALLIILVLFVAYLAIFKTRISDMILNIFTMKESNDLSRSRSLQSFFSIWKENPFSFFIGSGYSSEFYNIGLNQMVNNVELSYWNLLRRVGVFLFAIMMYMFFYPIAKTYKTETLTNIGYIAYLITAYTNPLLYTSTGITALIYMYYIMMKSQQAGEKELMVNTDPANSAIN